MKQDPDRNHYIPLCKGACWALFEVFKITIKSTHGCEVADESIVAACKAAGGGPEDPLADWCAVAFTTAFNAACDHLVDEGIDMDYDSCKKNVC